jgi:hypothetical protein
VIYLAGEARVVTILNTSKKNADLNNRSRDGKYFTFYLRMKRVPFTETLQFLRSRLLVEDYDDDDGDDNDDDNGDDDNDDNNDYGDDDDDDDGGGQISDTKCSKP